MMINSNNLVVVKKNTPRSTMQKYRDNLDAYIKTKIVVNTKDFIYILSPEKIVYIKASGNYSKIYDIDGNEIISSKTLKYFENKLMSKGFVRVHSGTLVNVEKISGIFRRSGNYTLELENGININVSRSYKEALFSYCF